jgi:hypothetical protein
MKQSRRHYGIGVSKLFREGKDPEEKSYTRVFDNSKFCHGRINWVISRVWSSHILSDNKVETDNV